MQIIHATLLLVLVLVVASVTAADVQYAVVAMLPPGAQSIAVSVDGASDLHPLSPSQACPQLFTGTAPSPAQHYRYIMLDAQGRPMATETHQRTWIQDATSTGHEFFNRSTTAHAVPSLPQAYHPVYPPSFTNMNRSNEIATILLEANSTAVQAILSDPKGNHDYARVERMTFISQHEIFSFTGSGLRNSGKSSKDFARQSFKIKLNEYRAADQEIQLLYGRTTLKLRSEPGDPTMMREKLTLDMLNAAGAVTFSSQWVRVFVNSEPYGLFLMTDDASTHFIENTIYMGDHTRTNTGPTYKMNAMNATHQGNLAYVGDDVGLYPESLYELEDAGTHEFPRKSDELVPLVQLMQQLQGSSNTDIQTLVDVRHTMLHIAMNMLTGAWDGMVHQASNYLMYKRDANEDGKWVVISFDYDEVLGVSVPEYHYMMTTPWQNFTPPGRLRPLIEPVLADEAAFNDVLTTLVKRFFKPAVLEPRIDAWREMLREDVAWNLALAPHAPNASIHTSWTLWNYDNNIERQDGQVIGLKQWIRDRSAAFCQQLGITDDDDLPPLGPYHSSAWPRIPAPSRHQLLVVLAIILFIV